MNRRDFHRFAVLGLGSLMKLALLVPGAAYLLSPLRKKAAESGLVSLTRLSQLQVGVPRAFAIIQDRQDAWVRYPGEPVGSVWLVRQPEGAKAPVLALNSECPHLGCAINLTADGKDFLCPCHTSAFELDGTPRNSVPPRPMDRLEVELGSGADPLVRVRFERFRTQSEEKIPLV
jgi:Rieske Fe-S protein